MIINLTIIFLVLNNIDFTKTIGKKFVAATLGISCANTDDNAYWDTGGYSTSPCCGLSCGCLTGGAGCSKCCPLIQDSGTRTYYCDANDYGQCFWCTTCTGGSDPRCSARTEELDECEAECGAAAECDDVKANSCSGGTIYCTANCQRDADNDADGIDNRCDTEITLEDCNDGIDNDGDGNIDLADGGCSGACASCEECGGGLDTCDRTECEDFCGLCYYIPGLIGGTCYSCSGASCTSYDTNQDTCTIDACDFGTCIWTGTSCCQKTYDGQEICDNIDNDCDGSIDEGVTKTCEDYTQGVCATSIQECTAGVWGDCKAKTSEACTDNLDNDCDGTTDCLDPDCFGQTDGNGHKCCKDASGLQNSSCPADIGCVHTGCADDNTKSGYSVDHFCGDSGFCTYIDISCNSDCASNGCCYPDSTQGVAVCSDEKAYTNVDDEENLEICCDGDWKGANCAALACVSTDAIDHDCCGISDCTDMTPGDCGVVVCESNNYACSVDQSVSLCLLVNGACGIVSDTCVAESQGMYNSYTCSYVSDNDECTGDDSDNNYCDCSGDSCECKNTCTNLCDPDCEYCYSACSVFATDGNEYTLPNDINSCISHGCWSECVT